MTERTEARQVAALASVTVRTAEMAEARSRWLAAILTAHAAGRSNHTWRWRAAGWTTR